MNRLIRRCSFAAIALASTLSVAVDAAPNPVVAIILQDSSVDPSIKTMTIKVDPATVKAGKVTLEAVNQSKDLVHEVVVAPALPEGKEMPYDKAKDEVVEKRVHRLGEISDLRPGARGKLTLALKPGTYLLFCNQPGHYKSGMWARLAVEK